MPFTADWQLPGPWPRRRREPDVPAEPELAVGTVVPPRTRAARWRSVDAARSCSTRPMPTSPSGTASSLRDRCRTSSSRARSASRTRSPGIRFGFAVADPNVVRELIKVKDSYNCDVLSLAAATAAIEDQEYLPRRAGEDPRHPRADEAGAARRSAST